MDEERMAAAGRPELPSDVAGAGGPQALGGQFPHAVGVEGRQVHVVDQVLDGQTLLPRQGIVIERSRGGQQPQGQSACASGQVPEEVEQQGIGLVKIVEDQHQGPSRGQLAEQGDQAIDQVETADGGPRARVPRSEYRRPGLETLEAGAVPLEDLRGNRIAGAGRGEEQIDRLADGSEGRTGGFATGRRGHGDTAGTQLGHAGFDES